MSVDSNTNGWKDGTDTLTICMICGAEYPPGTGMCPDCNASLSTVRRCPGCHRIVSFQHTKCVYCHTPFVNELPKSVPAQVVMNPSQRSATKNEQRLRAIGVSVLTFVVVFSLGLMFMRSFNQSSAPVLRVVAKAIALHPVELRHSPSLSSSVVDKVSSGTTVNITGSVAGDQGRRWLALDWNNAVAYVLASDLAAPDVLDVDGGATVLKFYLLGMESEAADGAVKAVDHYSQRFPGDVHGEELRWVLAERLRSLAQHGGGSEANLRHQAHAQYEALATSNGAYAEKAREALGRLPVPATGEASAPHRPERKQDGLQIVGGSGTQTSSTKSSTHEVLVLNKAEVVVRAGKLSQLTAGAVIQGRVARQVKTNGIVAIPAGASCQLTVMSVDSSSVTLGLTSIEIDHRIYAVKSAAIDTPSGEAAKQIVDRSLMFHLDAPLVIER